MIQHHITTWQDLSWQEELKNLITEPRTLFEMLNLDSARLSEAEAAAKLFPLRVTQSFVSRMTMGQLEDPLLKQVLPIGVELQPSPGFTDDPLDEAAFNPLPGLVHKYTNRVLVVATTSCAINCRYCFRRAFDYSGNRLSKQNWKAIFNYINKRPEIDEVIFSGGDPLLHSDDQFHWLMSELNKISHLERVRIHSRLPIVLPSRMTDELINIFSSSRLQAVLVIHTNHANEIDNQVGDALLSAHNSGLTVLNQAVLLRSINDNTAVQVRLAKRLFEFKVMPYYLHLLDKVTGSAHFDTDSAHALQLYAEMKAQLPGYLLPKLVREEAGASSKTIVSPAF